MLFKTTLRTISLIATLALTAVSGSVQAEVVYLQFNGSITSAAATSPLASIGDLISGSFSYDTATAASSTQNLAPGQQQVYVFGALSGITATVNGHTIVTPGFTLTLNDRPSGTVADTFSLFGTAASVDGTTLTGGRGGLPSGSFGFNLNSANPNALLSTALPTSLNFASFDSVASPNGGSLNNGASSLLTFSITSVTLVPELSALLLMLSGLLCVGVLSQRRM